MPQTAEGVVDEVVSLSDALADPDLDQDVQYVKVWRQDKQCYVLYPWIPIHLDEHEKVDQSKLYIRFGGGGS